MSMKSIQNLLFILSGITIATWLFLALFFGKIYWLHLLPDLAIVFILVALVFNDNPN